MKTVLSRLMDQQRQMALFSDYGMSAAEAISKSRLIKKAAEYLVADGNDASLSAHWCFVPGRVEVLGKHTDYAGGRSVICAAERGVCAVGIEREDRLLRMLDVQRGEQAEFRLGADLIPRQSHWSNYPMTVARRVARNFPGVDRGLEIAFASDLPAAAGMSSSSALVVMTFLLLNAANNIADYPEYRHNIDSLLKLGEYLGTIENGQTFGTLAGDRGVGTFGGSEDHTAILCSRPGSLAQFSYCPVRHERWIDLSAHYVFAIGVSGVVAEKTGSAMAAYNHAAQRANAIADLWRQHSGRSDENLAAIVASGQSPVVRVRQLLESHSHPDFETSGLIDRFEQFYAESEEIIPRVPDHLHAKSSELFGQLAHRSQMLGARKLGNQVAQTEWLAEAGERLGAAAASAFGAGFGGSVWALIDADRASTFVTDWQNQYAQAFPLDVSRASFFLTRPGTPAIV